MCWTKNQEAVVHGNLSKFVPSKRTFCLWPNANFDPGEFDSSLRAKKTEHCLFSISLSRASIFFKAKYLSHDQDGLLFEFPELVYKVQRRKDMRVPLKHLNMAGRIQGVGRKLLDISAGGLSFQVQEEESDSFRSGVALDSIEFVLAGRTIKVAGVVRHTVKGRVGAQFVALRPADQQYISGYVFQESRKLMSKYL